MEIASSNTIAGCLFAADELANGYRSKNFLRSLIAMTVTYARKQIIDWLNRKAYRFGLRDTRSNAQAQR
jgi:hypothetical protein